MDAIAQLKTALAGRYAVDKEIGHGGMATVYLARDVRHNRRVALKVLNPELGAVLGTERFLSEIQVTANLQHPNLLPLFDSGEADGLLFYVMPYVEGESLRAKLHREKQLPIDESVHIATAVLSALDYAHRHGVIHRDLKPENILMNEGQPLVADFGIALAVSNAGGNRITQTGLSLGTPQYMSPEQATGDRDVDGRTDVYSLGAVLYEMLSGEPPHDGKTSQAIIAKVLTDRPRGLRLSRDTIPPHIEAATERALAKIPADRFHSAHEFADALHGKGVVVPTEFRTPATTATAAHSRESSRVSIREWIAWAIAATALIGAAVLYTARDPVAGTSVLRYEIPLRSTSIATLGIGNPVAVSPGGRHIAFAAIDDDGVRKLYLKAANELRAREVIGSALARNPFFSPNGEWVAFYTGGQLRKASVSGGTSALLGEAVGASRASWSKAGTIVKAQGLRLARMPATGGRFELFTQTDSLNGETAQVAPLVLDDGVNVVYQSLAMGGASAARIGIASLKSGESRILEIAGTYPLGYHEGHLIYGTATGTVMAMALDLGSWKTRGSPIPVIDQVATESSGETFAALSEDGVLVLYSGSNRKRLVVASPGRELRAVLAEPQNIQWPRLSPNGRRVAMTISAAGRSDIWIYDLPDGPLARLTTDGTINDRPEWMPDGNSVLFRSNRGTLNSMWVQPVDGAGAARLFYGLPSSKVDEGVVSNDGRYLIFQRDSTGVADLWLKGLTGDTTARPIETTPAADMSGRPSPDGRWVAYQSAESGATQIYVRPVPSLGVRHQISLGGGYTPVWSRDGRGLFYASGGRVVKASIAMQPFFAVTRRETVLERELTFGTIHADFDVMPDGLGIMGLQSADEDAQLITIHNWIAELRTRLRGQAP